LGSTGGRGPERTEIAEVLEIVCREAEAFAASLDDRLVRDAGAEAGLRRLAGALPEEGEGAEGTLRLLVEAGLPAAAGSAGPRFFHFVTGGVTPAAMGADMLASAIDQVAYAHVSSPLGARLEEIALSWLLDLFELPGPRGAVMTSGATMANFVGLASARQWWGERLGRDVAEEGLAGLPPMPVLTSGFVHASAVKVLALLGIGRTSIRRFSRDVEGRIDLDGLASALGALGGAPAVVIANAGEVNAGEFDPIADLARLAKEHGAWLHVDGAFGLFARLSPRTAPLAAGTEDADSITVDGHKWLNVPYDCGFAFVRDEALQRRAFAYSAAYLKQADSGGPNYGVLGPESSRRARSLAVWATLKAYGRGGYRRMVERHLDLARLLAGLVDEAPELERLADTPLNIVCFRHNPGDRSEEALNLLNARLGEAILRDGRVYMGTTTFGTMTALRPAIVNWRTREEDVRFMVRVVRELAGRIVAEG